MKSAHDFGAALAQRVPLAGDTSFDIIRVSRFDYQEWCAYPE
jgi:hypothetical protein